jgi:hypothetical protein
MQKSRNKMQMLTSVGVEKIALRCFQLVRVVEDGKDEAGRTNRAHHCEDQNRRVVLLVRWLQACV